MVAKIADIDGVEEGEHINGVAPYFGNPKVHALVYRVADNKCGAKAADMCHATNMINAWQEISVAGSYAYTKID